MLSRQELESLPADDYMNEQQLSFFRALLLQQQKDTMLRIEQSRILLAQRPELNDDGDRAQHEEDLGLTLRIVEREEKLLAKIGMALGRIRSGEYGYCLESGEPIGIPRLLIRPTAEYCAEAKTLREEKEKRYAS